MRFESERMELEIPKGAFEKGALTILVHGYQGTPKQTMWRAVKKELEAAGAAVADANFPEKDFLNIHPDEKVAFLERVVREAKGKGVKRILLVGHSAGAVIAAKVAEKFQEELDVRLVGISAPPHYDALRTAYVNHANVVQKRKVHEVPEEWESSLHPKGHEWKWPRLEKEIRIYHAHDALVPKNVAREKDVVIELPKLEYPKGHPLENLVEPSHNFDDKAHATELAKAIVSLGWHS